MKSIIGLLCGIIFGAGLTVSQMVNPLKVVNFLDIFGHWDPSLAFVMMGALTVFGIGYFLFLKPRTHAINGEDMPLIPKGAIDRQLLVGASLFGIGWGLTGICPGPGIANLGSLNPDILVFVGVMTIGLIIGNKLQR